MRESELENIYSLSGFLLKSPNSHIKKLGLKNIIDGEFDFNFFIKDTNWESYTYTTNIPLNRELTYDKKGPYKYPIIHRPSGNKLLILSYNKRIILHFINRYLLSNNRQNWYYMDIKVDELVKDLAILQNDDEEIDAEGKKKVSETNKFNIDKLTKKDDEDKTQLELTVTYAQAEFAGGGERLKTISFYGDDIVESKFFRDNIELFSFYRCGLRRLTEKTELIRVGNLGSIYFNYENNETLIDIEKVLNEILSNYT